MSISCRTPFFVEKPLGSLDQLPRWREIAAMDLPVNQVGYMLRFHPDVQTMRSVVPAPDMIALDLAWDSSKYAEPLLESSHEIDLMCHLLGRQPDVLSAWSDGEAFVFSCVDADVRIWTRAPYRRRWSARDRCRSVGVTFSRPEDLGDQMYRDELVHFLDCVREQKPTICPLADGLKVLEVCAKIEAVTKANA